MNLIRGDRLQNRARPITTVWAKAKNRPYRSKSTAVVLPPQMSTAMRSFDAGL